jgi:AbrB family looped-hinge helix DNA binding protein
MAMDAVKISPKFQVVIPKEVRERLHLVAGQRLQIVAYGNRIEMIPEQKIGNMRGFLAGIDTEVAREDDRL